MLVFKSSSGQLTVFPELLTTLPSASLELEKGNDNAREEEFE